jgi:TRAP-type C4-dicarboxylate transport system permease large subunit
MMDAISRRVNRLTEWAMALLLAVMVLITGLAIAGRFVFSYSLFWSDEVTRFLLIWIPFPLALGRLVYRELKWGDVPEVLISTGLGTGVVMFIIFAPVLLPLAKKLGIDPVFFGVIMVVNLSMGLASPPSGATLFVSTAIAEERLDRVCRAVWPLFFSMVAILLLIPFVPTLVMWLPRLVYGR